MRLLFSLLLIIYVSEVNAQYFEGHITYENSFESKIPGVSNEQLTTMLGKDQEFFIKDNHYKSITSGTLLKWQVYVPTFNLIYTKMSNVDTAMVVDASKNPDEVVSSVVNKNVETILGKQCDELILTTKTGVIKFYYPSDLLINYEAFKTHLYGNWYTYVSTAKSLYLKSVMETPQFIMTGIAVKITPEKLDAAAFAVPK